MRAQVNVKKNLLPQVAQQLPRAALDIVQHVGTGIQARSIARTPIRTGTLANAWAFEFEQTPTGAYGEVFNNVEYAPYIEYGTYKMSAQPMLWPCR